MITNVVETIYTYAVQIQHTFAVILGMFVQFWFSGSKGGRVVVTILVSSIFVALYLVPNLIALINYTILSPMNYSITTGSDVGYMLYACSSLISIELIAILINVLPLFAKKKITNYLGVEDEKSS